MGRKAFSINVRESVRELKSGTEPERLVIFGDGESSIFQLQSVPTFDALRLLPWQKAPDKWRLCPVCGGDGGGCGDCGGSGHVHVGRFNWLIFQLLRIKRLTWSIEEEWLADERLPRRTRRTHEWQTGQAALARTLMSRWAAEDGHPNDLTRAHSHKD